MAFQKEIDAVLSNALIAFGGIGLSLGMAIPFTVLQMFVDAPALDQIDDPELREQINTRLENESKFANAMSNASRFFIGIGSFTMALGIFVGVRRYVTNARETLIRIAAPLAILAGLVITFQLLQKAGVLPGGG